MMSCYPCIVDKVDKVTHHISSNCIRAMSNAMCTILEGQLRLMSVKIIFILSDTSSFYGSKLVKG
jgi:hypothetical protein